MEGMLSFARTPMAPIGMEVMIHIKPNRHQTWGYHAIRAWYFAPALNHYGFIKAVTEAGAVRVSDTFKFLHHSVPEPIISNTDRIVKATQHLIRTINGHPDAPPDELQAILGLKDLISGAANQKQMPDPVVKPEHRPSNKVVVSKQIPKPISISPDPIHAALAARVDQNQPNVILR
jgi:hypothetical protein